MLHFEAQAEVAEHILSSHKDQYYINQALSKSFTIRLCFALGYEAKTKCRNKKIIFV